MTTFGQSHFFVSPGAYGNFYTKLGLHNLEWVPKSLPCLGFTKGRVSRQIGSSQMKLKTLSHFLGRHHFNQNQVALVSPINTTYASDILTLSCKGEIFLAGFHHNTDALRSEVNTVHFGCIDYSDWVGTIM